MLAGPAPEDDVLSRRLFVGLVNPSAAPRRQKCVASAPPPAPADAANAWCYVGGLCACSCLFLGAQLGFMNRGVSVKAEAGQRSALLCLSLAV